MAMTTYSDISSFINSIYERSLFVVREMNLMSNLVENYSAQGWMTRTFSTRPEISAETVSDGVDYTNATSFGKSSVGTLTPQEAIAQVVLTDRNVESDPDGARNDAATELGSAIATKIDEDLVSVFSSLSVDAGAGAGSPATIATFAEAVALLKVAKAPTTNLNAVVHPYHWHDVWVELGQPAATYSNLGDAMNEALRDYFMGRFLALNWYTSTNISVDASDDAISGVFSRQALALDMRRAYRLEPERDASLRAWELNATAGYAYGLGPRPAFGVKYTADATAP